MTTITTSTITSLASYAAALLDEAAVDRMVATVTAHSGRLLDNRQAAELVSDLLFPVSHRTVESWSDLRARSFVVNRKRMQRPEDVVEAALHRIEAGWEKRDAFNGAAAAA